MSVSTVFMRTNAQVQGRLAEARTSHWNLLLGLCTYTLNRALIVVSSSAVLIKNVRKYIYRMLV